MFTSLGLSRPPATPKPAPGEVAAPRRPLWGSFTGASGGWDAAGLVPWQWRGSGFWSCAPTPLSRGAAGILGKAILLFRGVSVALAPQVPRTKCQSSPLPHGHLQMLPGLNTLAGTSGPGTSAAVTSRSETGSQAARSTSPRSCWAWAKSSPTFSKAAVSPHILSGHPR